MRGGNIILASSSLALLIPRNVWLNALPIMASGMQSCGMGDLAGSEWVYLRIPEFT